MSYLSSRGSAVSPSLSAGLLLASLPLLSSCGLPHPSATEAIAATGASRSRAYEVKAKLEQALPDLVRPPGRPPQAPPESQPETEDLTRAALRYVMDHPGSVHGGPTRRRYSDAFRIFVLELCEQHPDIDLGTFADAIEIPLGTIKDWLRGGRDAVDDVAPTDLGTAPSDDAKGPRIESVLAAWKRWDGSFVSFCDHVQLHLRIPWGRTMIAEVLEATGVRIRTKRRGREPDEKALRNQFETFFPGAMWSADGTPLNVTVNGGTFTFNLELEVDTHTGALVGMSLRDTEDGLAVVDAFCDGTCSAGAAPLAQLLDNRPSNHTDEVTDALGDTLKIRRTKGRPQNGAHVEGAFGLFQQTAPAIDIEAGDLRELARQILGIQVQTWARALNHKPRTDKDKRSRVKRYTDDTPGPGEVEAARLALAERLTKQEKAQQTRRARLDPITRQILDEAFEELGLLDPDGFIRDAIAGYPLDAVLAGIAAFESKGERGTLPEEVDGRYLLGIVRNIAHEDEGVAFAEALWQARLAAGDVVLQNLDQQREEIEDHTDDPLDLLRRLLDLAMATDRALDRAFWLRAVADAFEAQPRSEHHAMFKIAARRIHANHRVPKRDRNAATRRLAALVRPIA